MPRFEWNDSVFIAPCVGCKQSRLGRSPACAVLHAKAILVAK